MGKKKKKKKKIVDENYSILEYLQSFNSSDTKLIKFTIKKQLCRWNCLQK